MKTALISFLVSFTIIVIAGFALAGTALFAPVHPAASIDQGLRSKTFDTGAFDCDGSTRTWMIDMPAGKIKQAEAWQGMDKGAVADFSLVAYVGTYDRLLFIYNWDHYRDPGGAGDQITQRDFGSEFINIAEGERVTIFSTCISYAGPTHGRVMLTAWFVP